MIEYARSSDDVKRYNEQLKRKMETKRISFVIEASLGNKLDECLKKDNVSKTKFFNDCAKEYVARSTYAHRPESTKLIHAITTIATEFNMMYNHSAVNIPKSIKERINSAINELYYIDRDLYGTNIGDDEYVEEEETEPEE